MTGGRLIAVVGPSGVGKDSIISGIVDAAPDIHRVKRVITRPSELGGEDYTAVTATQFSDMAAQGLFCLQWSAHGLQYGIPATTLERIAAGDTCIANLSRGVLMDAKSVFPKLLVLKITASPDILAERLAGRGRETAEQIANRLARSEKPIPAAVDVTEISNNGPLDETIAAALVAIQAERV
ncbi:phosphonate metabolism protein/1,5-bisphosphokinase (PRPP-forming) PhnN [Pseudaestuariivita rosea]|uniref:phosphonate metabolism protein/1,5-bisphosphokinase (PRPP-forming) PhnN n=1 Tax=Pseudaestuariivita rosea TaxID=2763263 RepID=UPI001ABAD722|nr:phosphonate metabolism protein/1,5-bisphosphokinase (PRPP-forming) PhnN [Pseudaestuariivita rosea]